MLGRATCSFVREDGSQCRAAPLREGEFCFWHSPDHSEEAAEARRLGGQRRKRERVVSGAFEFEGIDSIGAAATAMNEIGHAPLAHFVTNIIAAGSGEDEAAVQSKGLMIMADGSIHAVTYQDTFRVDDGAWRISRRVVIPRHTDRTEQ